MSQGNFSASPGAAFPTSALAPVFVFACAWRSGSTLLQRLVTSSRQVLVWGENAAMTAFLMRIQKNIDQWESLIHKQHKNFQAHDTNAWIANLNPVPPDPALEASRAFFLHYYFPATQALNYDRWGFKEVRHGAAQAQYLLKCFPEGRVIFLVRDPRDVVASNAANHWYRDIGGATGVAKRWIRSVESFASLVDERIMTVRYEDLCSARDTIVDQLESHLVLTHDSIDLNVLNARVRGARTSPRLGIDEERALANESLVGLAKAHGYHMAGLNRGPE